MPDKLDRAIDNHRRYNNVDTRIGYLGDGSGSGDPRVRDASGRYWVRFPQGSGFTIAVALPLDTNANIPPSDGIPVEVGYVKNEQCILKVYRQGLVQAGTPPAITNPSDPQVQETKKLTDINNFLCKRTSDSSKPWEVVVFDGYIEVDGVSRVFNQTVFDFDDAGLLPSLGERIIGCIFLKTDMTLEVFTSTTIALPTDPISESMIDEARQQAALDSTSIWGWILDGDATGLNENKGFNIDMRPKFSPPTRRSATLTTTNNTTTTIASIAVAELQAMTITVTVTGSKSDYSASCGGTLTAVVRRASGGNVTLVGSVTTDIHEDSGGSPTFTLDVDTGTQTARIRVTGISAEDWLWKCRYETLAY